MNIVLTGASRGIGFETALALASYDVSNLILISRNLENLSRLKQICISKNKNVHVTNIAEDINELTRHPELFYQKIQLQSIDILINNAGYLVNKPLDEISDSEISEIFEVNYFAPVRLIRLLLNHLRKDTPSHVVNIGSMGGFQGSSKYPGLSIYSSSKAALSNLTECLASEFSKSNIRFNCLALGAVQTEMLTEAFPGYTAPVNASEMGQYIADFAINGSKIYNGKILPLSVTNP